MWGSESVQQCVFYIEVFAHYTSIIWSADDTVWNQGTARNALNCLCVLRVTYFFVNLQRVGTWQVHYRAIVSRIRDAVISVNS